MRNAAINLRALPAQRDLIDQAANLLGKNRSDFMLDAACDKAQSVVLDQVFFRLDTDKFKQFTQRLDAPPTTRGLHASWRSRLLGRHEFAAERAATATDRPFSG